MKVHQTFVAAMLCVQGSTQAQNASCTARSTGAALIELYTSEGCNSCPPADAWLNKLSLGPKIIPVAFHVDYWAYLGWADRFTLPTNENQHAQRARSAHVGVYTPAIFINGSSARIGSETLPEVKNETMPAWHLEVQWNEAARSIQVNAFEKPSACKETNCRKPIAARFALTENALKSVINAGENDGRSFSHNHVARMLWQDAKAQDVPSDVKLEQSQIIAWRESDQKATDAIGVTLKNCR
jgi:hypothetical protein